MRFHHLEICQRDDGLWQIGVDDSGPGPFESREFALRVAGANPPKPAPVPARNFRRIKIRGVRGNASA